MAIQDRFIRPALRLIGNLALDLSIPVAAFVTSAAVAHGLDALPPFVTDSFSVSLTPEGALIDGFTAGVGASIGTNLVRRLFSSDRLSDVKEKYDNGMVPILGGISTIMSSEVGALVELAKYFPNSPVEMAIKATIGMALAAAASIGSGHALRTALAEQKKNPQPPSLRSI